VAIATCPKCTTKLKVPDGTTASVRCPKCQTVFKTSAPPTAPAAPQFEVVDEKPSKPAGKPAAKPVAPPSAAAAKPDNPFSNLDDDDHPKKKRTRDDDEEEDRPKKKRRDEDEEDDRPRSKKRTRDEDEDDDRPKKKRRDEDDDDDDRPRNKKRERDDDDDDRPRKKRRDSRDDYDDAPPGKSSKFGLARTGVLLVLISLGIYAGSMLLQLLFMMIALVGGVVPSGMSLMTGLLGLANWVTGLIGLGFCIAGPTRARGLAIAAVSVAAVHLILGFIVANDSTPTNGADAVIQTLSFFNRAENAEELVKELSKEMQKNPGSARAKELQEELKEIGDDSKDFALDRRGSKSKMRWGDMTTAITTPDKLIAILAYESKAFSDYLLGFFWGLTELARLILISLMLGSMAGVLREQSAASKAKLGWILAASAAGAGLLILLLAAVVFDSYKKDAAKDVGKDKDKSIYSAIKAPLRWIAGGEFLSLALHTGSVALPALAALGVYSASGGGGGHRSRPKKRSRRDDDDDD